MQLRNLKQSVKKERKCKTISQSQNKAMDAKTLSWHPQGTEKNKWQVRILLTAKIFFKNEGKI